VTLCATLLVALALAQVRPTGTPAAHAATALLWTHKGFSMAVWDANALNNSDAALQQLASSGANSVTFVVTWYQTSTSSSSIFATGSTASDASLVHAMQKARSLGLQVNLKPQVDSQDGLWRAYIQPTDPTSWFNGYSSMIGHYADLLQQNGGSVLVIGSELITLSTNSAYTAQWRSLISNLRGRFAGKLTYGGNWGSGDFAEEFTRITFQDALDYIGINAYFPVANQGQTPTVDSVKSFWTSWITQKIGPYQQQFNKPVMFTEIGYRSATGTAAAPFDSWSIWPLNTQEQVTCYEGLFQAWANVPWFVGTAFWTWNVNTNVSPTDIWYEVQNKPAQSTIQSWFSAGNTGPTPTPSSSGSPTIQIFNPLSNQTYTGTITVKAFAQNAQTVAYAVDAGAETAMAFNSTSGLYEAPLDTTKLANGGHNVDGINHGLNGTTVTDRAWNVQVSNQAGSATATPTPTPVAATPTPTSVATGPPSITIMNPQSNQTYHGTIQVQAQGQNLQSATYDVDSGAAVPMTFDSNLKIWSASLDTTSLSGTHNVDVVGKGTNGATVTDRAWNVLFTNTNATSTPTPSPAPSITITNPLSNATVTRTIVVSAQASNATRVTYQVDSGSQIQMSFDSASGLWKGSLNTASVPNGQHDVTVTAVNASGATAQDRAWRVNFTN
jgi:uncharacterized protein (DUF2147 family)